MFKVTATEITSPGNKRPAIQFNELVRFDNGKIYSTLISRYFANGCDYTSEVDGKRMIALKVIKFDASASGDCKWSGSDCNVQR